MSLLIFLTSISWDKPWFSAFLIIIIIIIFW